MTTCKLYHLSRYNVISNYLEFTILTMADNKNTVNILYADITLFCLLLCI